MYFTKGYFIPAALLATSTVQAHMMMANPIPFGQDSLNNFPLAGDGSDFPCKLRSDTYEYTPEVLSHNTFHVGDQPLLSFIGSATHGGGSCQISLTTDLEPSTKSQWMVIHSIEGGCPANVPGNSPGGASTPDPTTFNFTIPDIADGRYTLAWTWFNRIGNREMYMNCAPIQILANSGSKKREAKSLSKQADFPGLFIANINGCITPEGVDIHFPNPGDSVDYLGEPANLQPSGSPACTGGAGITATGANPAATPTITGTAVGHPGDAPGSPSTSVLTVVPVLSTAAPQAGPETVPAPPRETSTPANPPTSSTAGALSGACSTEGEWNCINETSFQRCASGIWSIVESVAPGTKCTSGESHDLQVVAEKRGHTSHMHRRRHLLFAHTRP